MEKTGKGKSRKQDGGATGTYFFGGFIDGISVSARPHYLALSPQHSGYMRFISKCMRVY